MAPAGISALRHERATRRGHHMLAKLGTKAYPVYGRHQYPTMPADDDVTDYERNNRLIEHAKLGLEQMRLR